MSLFAGLTAVGGLIRIPLPLVPLTMQTFFVYLSGIFLRSRKGSISQIIFLVVGLLGIPIFGLGGGVMYVLQPSFGYLLAFPVASWIMGKMVGENFDPGNLQRYIFGSLLAMFSILVIGTAFLWLNLLFITMAPISWKKAITAGLLIFLPGEILKLIGVYFLSKRLSRFKFRVV